MTTYSSTLLKYFNDNCPAALAKQLACVPYDRDYFNPGIAAHVVLQYIGQKQAKDEASQRAVADAVVFELTTKGREFNGVHEPPMSPMAAFEGRDLALQWLQWNELPENGLYETGLGMTATGEPCAYDDPKCRYRAVIDAVVPEILGDEDYAVEAMAVNDYKSAWPTNDSELDTLQRRGQIVLVAKHNPEAGAVIARAINLRTGVPFERVIYRNDEGNALLEQWEADILQTCKAADQTTEARPGAGCLTCPYTLSCDDCIEQYKGNGSSQAVMYAAMEAARKELQKVLKAKALVTRFAVPGGFVGFKTINKKIVKPDAHRHLCEHWYMNDSDPHTEEQSLLSACNLTTGSIDKMVKVMYPEKNDIAREELLELCIDTQGESRFGVHKS